MGVSMRGGAKARGADAPAGAMIARALREVYRGPAWHGPSVLAALRGVTAEMASWRPAAGRNTIHDLVLHLAYTRHRVLARLAGFGGGRTTRFPRQLRASWFPEGGDGIDAASWKADLALLEEYQERVLAAVEQAGATTLARRRSGTSRTIASELLGLVSHDAYHAGQIRLLAKLASAPDAPSRPL